MSEREVLLRTEGLTVRFPVKREKLFERRKYVHAVTEASIGIFKGEIFGLVGESGCGKSTFANATLGFIPPNEGKVYFCGELLDTKNKRSFRRQRMHMQKIFQDPSPSLSPRFTVEQAIAEPMIIRGGFTDAERRKRIGEMLSLIGLCESDMFRYVTEFSGGQKQRIAIARALIMHPDYIVCDEPVSALDVSVHAQILNLLKDLGERFGLTYLFISHNLAAVRKLCDRIAIMYLGHIVEYGDTAEIFAHPMHPYTKALISAVLTVDTEDNTGRMLLKGEIASPIDLPGGCVFSPRCPFACDKCRNYVCALTEIGDSHFAACPRALKGEIAL